MKLILGLTVLLLAVFVNQISVSMATSEPVCYYTNSEDKMIFLKFFRYNMKGEEYVDFGKDGKCLKKVTCPETYINQIEDCEAFPVTCENKNKYNGVFPACCVKC